MSSPWKAKTKYGAPLNVSQEQWDKIFGKKKKWPQEEYDYQEDNDPDNADDPDYAVPKEPLDSWLRGM
jgi:hypothetical protein